MSEAAQWPIVAREVWKKICDLYFSGKEAALAASRYIEGHALALRKQNPYRPRSSIHPAHSVAGHTSLARYARVGWPSRPAPDGPALVEF